MKNSGQRLIDEVRMIAASAAETEPAVKKFIREHGAKLHQFALKVRGASPSQGSVRKWCRGSPQSLETKKTPVIYLLTRFLQNSPILKERIIDSSPGTSILCRT